MKLLLNLFLLSSLVVIPMHAAIPPYALPSKSGYLPVDQSSGARIFYAYYEAISPQQELSKTPILLWFQGGPGCSGMLGNFYELGPWRVGEDKKLHQNRAPWNRKFGVLFVDNPVGTGFSVAPNEDDIPTDEEHVARDMYTALEAFFDGHKDFLDRPFYVTGESYAGKYVPVVSDYILWNKDSGEGSIRLDGIAIGNGLTHPITQVLAHGPTAYAMGLIDANQAATVQELAAKVVALIENQNWAEAHTQRSDLLLYLQNKTGLATLYDVRRLTAYYTTESGEDYWTEFLNLPDVQTQLGTERLEWVDCSDLVADRMANDTMKSTKHLVENLLKRMIPTLLYQGQFDLQDGVASTEAWMQLIEWEGMTEFWQSDRRIWTENGILAGYVRSYSSLTHVVVSNAGHLVPTDQNYHSQRMMEGWISGTMIAEL